MRSLMAVLLLVSVASASPTRKVRVEKRDLRNVIKVEVTMAPKELATLGSPTAGVVREVLVDAATMVKKGQKLLGIEPAKGGKLAAVMAPFDGVVISRTAVPGVFVTEGGSLLTVASDLSSLRAELEVPETLVPMLKVGTQISLAFESYPGRVYAATVVTQVPWIDARTRTQHCDAAVANPDHALLPGMSGVATWVYAQHPGLAAPNAAIVREGDHAFVLRAVGGKAVKVPVSLGILDGELVEILTGAAENDELLLGLKEGQKVE